MPRHLCVKRIVWFSEIVVLATSSSAVTNFIIIQIYNLDELKIEHKFLIKYVYLHNYMKKFKY
jgi:hypothetical protein